MKARSALLIVSLLAALLVPAAGCSRQAPIDRGLDSLLLVTLDTLRADHLSCYGSTKVQTPEIDALASRGVRMSCAWTSVPLTTPAHASILTGLYPPGHGVRNNGRFRLPDRVTTLAEVMKQQGRRTAAFVSAFPTSRLFGLAQGFETFDDDFGFGNNGKKRNSRRGDETVERAASWLREKAGKPFFAWVHLYDAHTPYTPPPEFGSRYPSDPYAGEVAFVDALVGRLVKLIDEIGATSRTVIVVIADHGEGLRTHGEVEHGLLLYEETVAIPFVIVAPGRADAGTVVDLPASVVDLVPTVCGLLGIEPPKRVQGRDLFDTAAGQREVSLYAETLYPHEEFGWSALYALRRGELKYIAAPTAELYDLTQDPGETKSLAEARPEETRKLAAELTSRGMELLDNENLAAAAGLSEGDEEESIARLESLGYVAGGAAADLVGESSTALPAVGGRNPRDGVDDVFALHRAQEMLRAGYAEASVKLLEKVLARDPDNPQILLKFGLSQQVAGDVKAAEATYRSLLEAHPTFFLGTSRLSSLLVKQGRLDEARLLWERLASLVPGYVAIPLQLAEIEIKLGRAADAAARLEGLLDRRPDDAGAWCLLGDARDSLGQENGAFDAWSKGLEHSASEKRCVEGCVRVLLDRDQARQARLLVEGLLSRAPGDPFLSEVREKLPR